MVVLIMIQLKNLELYDLLSVYVIYVSEVAKE